MTNEEVKLAKKKAHLDFMNKCFEEADNIISQSQSSDEYDEIYTQGFRHGYWMARWIELGDQGIHWGFENE
jgi:soluble cytochrome b562